MLPVPRKGAQNPVHICFSPQAIGRVAFRFLKIGLQVVQPDQPHHCPRRRELAKPFGVAAPNIVRPGETLPVRLLYRGANDLPQFLSRHQHPGGERKVAEIKKLRKGGMTVPDIMRRTKFSKASVYRALSAV